MKDKIFIIGDCHGEYEKLRSLLANIPYERNDQIYFVGDLIDRGPDSAKLIKFIRDSQFNVVKGNHETFAEEAKGSIFNGAMYGEIYNFWGSNNNGGKETFNSYYNEYGKLAYVTLLDDIEYFKTLPELLIVNVNSFNKKILITHGSFLDNIDSYLNILLKIEGKDEDEAIDILTINELSIFFSHKKLILYNRIFPKKENLNYFNIFGHTIVGEHIVNFATYNKNGIYLNEEIGFAAIDTGAFLNKDSKLSAISFPDLNVYTN